MGYGPTDAIVQNGIQVGRGAAGTVGPGNRVSHISYTPGDAAASSILVISAAADVVDNTIAHGQVGVYFWEAGGRIARNTVVGSAVEIGSSRYWGLIVTDGGPDATWAEAAAERTLRPSPLGGEGSALRSTAPPLEPQALATVEVEANHLWGGADSGSSVGLEADVRCEAGDLDLNVTYNRVGGWGYGIVLYQCTEEDLQSAVPLASMEVHWNQIAGNDPYGMYISGFALPVDARNNWWGAESGPYDGSEEGLYNPDGEGDVVTDGVDYSTWLERSYMPLMAHGFALASLPDLRVSSLSVEPSDPVTGQDVTVTVEVVNVGPEAAGPFWVDLYDNPLPPPDGANQVWNYICSGALEDCYGIAWYVAGGLAHGESIVLSSAGGYQVDQTHWVDAFVGRGRHDLYAFADSWNGTVWYGAVLEEHEGIDNRFGPLTVCVAPGSMTVSHGTEDEVEPIPLRPERP
jgi:hypothetical protein